MSRAEFAAELTAVSPLTPTVRLFSFATGAEPLAFEPGQFVMIHFEIDGETWQRSYSIASIAPDGEPLSIAVAPVDGGRATRFLWGLKPGDQVRMSGPYGRFCLRADEQPPHLALVGTGTGIAPYRAMIPLLRDRAAAGLRTSVILGVRTADELLYADAFRALAAEFPAFSFIGCLSRADASLPDERRCYVTATLESLGLDAEAGDVAYLCGNPQMVDDAVELLKTQGFSPRNIRREKYI